ncbi:hypothetical protein BGZ72_003608 [Mortierella alpina]|nr:hypothetical protein BGZ72_003608 [Mortierella alpina]
MTEKPRRALLISERAIKRHIRHHLSSTEQGTWEITILLKNLFKEYYLSDDYDKDQAMFRQWFSDVFREYAGENAEAQKLLPNLNLLLEAYPVQSCFMEETGKTVIKADLLADVVEDLQVATTER